VYSVWCLGYSVWCFVIMEKSYSYKDLNVYQSSKQLVVEVYTLLKIFPVDERYALCDQLRRAAVSVPSNIAEGMSRYSNKEKVHFIEIAYGSLMEVECQMDIAKDLQYISTEQYQQLESSIQSTAKMISSLRTSLLDKERNNEK